LLKTSDTEKILKATKDEKLHFMERNKHNEDSKLLKPGGS
jgi:hypothetical protein